MIRNMFCEKVFLFALFFVSLSAANADLNIALTTIGDPGNTEDRPYMDQEFAVGAVDYVYQIGTYEVTVGQYAEFLNAKAASDPYGLYQANMSDPLMDGGAIITRDGEDGSYTYGVVPGRETQPMRLVNFYDCLRFCNWLHNGQGDGDTEDGSYTLSDGFRLTRNQEASWVLASKDEWHKAAYYNPETGTYSQYPNGRDTIEYPTDETTPRELNFGSSPYWYGSVHLTSIGETTGCSAYGVCDMGGNVEEWTDSLNPPGQGSYRVVCGGMYSSSDSYLARDGAVSQDPIYAGDGRGFRLVCLVPEPSTMILTLLGFLGIRLFCKKRFR